MVEVKALSSLTRDNSLNGDQNSKIKQPTKVSPDDGEIKHESETPETLNKED